MRPGTQPFTCLFSPLPSIYATHVKRFHENSTSSCSLATIDQTAHVAMEPHDFKKSVRNDKKSNFERASFDVSFAKKVLMALRGLCDSLTRSQSDKNHPFLNSLGAASTIIHEVINPFESTSAFHVETVIWKALTAIEHLCRVSRAQSLCGPLPEWQKTNLPRTR